MEQWTSLVKLTGEAIDWLDANERVYDIWLLVAYCATSCAFVQVSRSFIYLTHIFTLTGESSITLGYDARMRKLRLNYACYETVYGDGKDRYRLTICQLDARSVIYLSYSLFNLTNIPSCHKSHRLPRSSLYSTKPPKAHLYPVKPPP